MANNYNEADLMKLANEFLARGDAAHEHGYPETAAAAWRRARVLREAAVILFPLD